MPVGTLLGQQPPRPPRWHTLIQWRDWKLPVKLAAITVVPIVIALILGAVTIANQVERSDSYQRIDRLVTLNAGVRAVLGGLQRERTETAAVLTEGTVDGTTELAAIRAQVDAELPVLRKAAVKGGEYDPRVIGPVKEMTAQIDRLPGIREAASSGQLDPVQAVNDYAAVASVLLKLDKTLVAGISDDSIGGAPSAMHDLEVAKEELSIEQALVGYGIARGNLAPTELNRLRNAEMRITDRLADFRATASQVQRQDFDTAATGPSFDTRERLINTALADDLPSEEAMRRIDPAQWVSTSASAIQGVGEVSGRLGTAVDAVSADLVEGSSSGAGLLAVLLFGALLLAAAVVFLVNRQLLRSLKTLRSGALDIAEEQLPAAVRNIQDGRDQGTDVEPVPVETNDEVGEVARAFDAVHSQALRLAVDQAAMRTAYGTVFVNLSRRSQSLVQRQLQLIERLERDEEDADQLATLFRLDHLATRMRRNNENLLVLSGSDPGRRSGAPIPTTDVLRAAVSEIEQYQRVVVQPPPRSRIVGYAASDLMRLIAELLDNATAFSAPQTEVTVATRLGADGTLSVDILDKGIGMNEAEMREANTRLAEADSVDLATSRRLGLFVVGRLAGRHSIGVALYGGKDIVGVRATVTVPAALVMEPAAPGTRTPRDTAPPPTERVPEQGTGESSAGRSPSGLPRRKPGNGAGRSRMLTQFSGIQQPSAPRENGRADAPAPVNGGSALFNPASAPEQPAAEDAAPRDTAPEQPSAARPGAGEERPDAGTEPTADSPATPPAGEPVDVDALPGGQSLFAANGSALSDWWQAEATAGEAERAARRAAAPERPETTPIFDAMLSVWFRSDTPADGAAPRPGAETDTPSWDFASDARWRTVQEVSRSQPDSYTDAGLPRRRRGEKLLPGSVSGSPATDATPDSGVAEANLPVRDPAQVRSRLSRFQQGVQRGRGRRAGQPPAAGGELGPQATAPAEAPHGGLAGPVGAPGGVPDASPAGKTVPDAKVGDGAALGASVPADAGPDAASLPEAAPNAAVPDAPVAEAAEQDSAAPEPARADPPRAEPADRVEHSMFERSVFEQAASPEQAAAPEQAAPEQTAAPEQAAPSESPAIPAPFAPPTPAQRAPKGVARPESAIPPTAAETAQTASGWTFAADESWRTVQSASQAVPETFTSAGLPQRRRGEQLMPGSAASSDPTPGARRGRDPQDVRSRLSSFQQGIRRGRHRSARAADADTGNAAAPNQEKMEGE